MKLTLLLIFILVTSTFAQEKTEETSAPAVKRKGNIQGQLLGEDGQPLEGVRVYLNAVGGYGGRDSTTDDEGKFLIENLGAGAYYLEYYKHAFVGSAQLENKYFYPGSNLTVTLIKGGVITGRVTDAKGEPVIAVRIQVRRVKELDGRKIVEQSNGFYSERKTDDRGIYRLYGLREGRYIVFAGGESRNGSSLNQKYAGDTPTFYPSNSRDSAVEVLVGQSEEVRAIDIRYRAGDGHSISGKVAGASTENMNREVSFLVSLRTYPERDGVSSTYISPSDTSRGFMFAAVADGEYELLASSYSGTGDSYDTAASLPRRVTVKNNNLANIELRLIRHGEIKGNVELETLPEAGKNTCKSLRDSSLEEFVFQIEKEKTDPTYFAKTESNSGRAVANEKREFRIHPLESGLYFFSARLTDESFYLKSITQKMSLTDAKKPAPALVEIGTSGLSLAPGEKKSGVVLTVAEGGASLHGRIEASNDKPLPARMRIFLVPVAKESAHDLLFYREKKISDANFAVTNLPPGAFWIVVHAVPDDEADDAFLNPLVWDAAKRMALRKEAEAAHQVIELKPCERKNDLIVKLAK